MATNLHHQIYQTGGAQSQIMTHNRTMKTHVRKASMRHYITCLSEGMKKFMVKPVNYDKVQEVTQEIDENLAVFLSQVTEAFRKHTNID